MLTLYTYLYEVAECNLEVKTYVFYLFIYPYMLVIINAKQSAISVTFQNQEFDMWYNVT